MGRELADNKLAQAGTAMAAVGALGTSTTLGNVTGCLMATKVGYLLGTIGLSVASAPVVLAVGCGVAVVGAIQHLTEDT